MLASLRVSKLSKPPSVPIALSAGVGTASHGIALCPYQVSTHFGWPWKCKGSTFFGRVEGLIRKVFPDMSDDKVYELLKRRAPAQVESWLQSEQSVEQLEGVLDDLDRKVCRDTTKDKNSKKGVSEQIAAHVQEKVGGKTADPAGSRNLNAESSAKAQKPAARSSAGASAGGGPKPAKSAGSLVDRATRMLPQPAPSVGRCFIQPYPHLRRHQVYYPREEFPRSCSRTWSADGSLGSITEKSVLVRLLTWAWDRHTEATGQACPHKFDDL